MFGSGFQAEAFVAKRLLRESANRGEAIISLARTGFCIVILGRFLFIEAHETESERLWRAAVEVPLLMFAILASIAAFSAAQIHRFNEHGLSAMSVIDAAVCSLSLAVNVLWPDKEYLGLLRMPDVAATIATVWISVLRLSRRATLASAATQLAFLIALIVMDQILNPTMIAYGINEVTMVLILLMASGAAAWATAERTASLVEQAGAGSARLERAKQNVNVLLREHHDVRTLLSSAQLNLQLAARAIQPDIDPFQFNTVQRAIATVAESVKHIRERAFTEFVMMEGIATVELTMSLRTAIAATNLRFPNVSITTDVAKPQYVRIVGGDQALAHLLLNALINACEGNGQKTASRINVSMLGTDRNGANYVNILVTDNGPGFTRDLLEVSPVSGLTTKADGAGLGLALMAQLVQASDGLLHISNCSEGGAQVSICLLRVSPDMSSKKVWHSL